MPANAAIAFGTLQNKPSDDEEDGFSAIVFESFTEEQAHDESVR